MHNLTRGTLKASYRLAFSFVSIVRDIRITAVCLLFVGIQPRAGERLAKFYLYKMIRIYFDWNIITELKKDDGGKYKSLKQKIEKYRNALLIPFSNYHVEDLIKNNTSAEKIEKFVKKDLEYLEILSQCHFLGVDKDGRILPQIGSPLKFIETIGEAGNIEELLDFDKLFDSIDSTIDDENKIQFGTLFKSLYQLQPVPPQFNNVENTPLLTKLFPDVDKANNMWDVMKGFSSFNKNLFLNKNFIKEFRSDVQKLSLESDSNHGNWKPNEVLENLNKGFQAKGINITFQELLETTLKNQKNITRCTYFTSAYLLLDFYGYRPDRLNKPSNTFQNITNDAFHSYIGAYCDFLVSDDDRLLAKSKVLYHEFNIEAAILSPPEFDEIIDTVVHSPIESVDKTFESAVNFIDEKFRIQSIQQEQGAIYHIYKLPIYFFNYFNYLIVEAPEEGLSILTFRRVFKNYSDFVYYSDTTQLLKDLFNCLGRTNDGKLFDDIENDFVYIENNKEKNIVWSFGKVHFILEKEVELLRECLKIIIDTRCDYK